jgi:DNA-binding MurR/RpiR family transcriptional regulator
VRLAIGELARRTGTGDATVLRFCKKVGAHGYGDFKIRLAQDLASSHAAAYVPQQPEDSLSVPLRKSVSADVKAMEDTLAIADVGALVAAAKALLNARRADIYGSGGAAVAAEELRFKLTRVGVRCMAHVDGEMQYMSASLLGAPDVAIGISHSGESTDVCEAITEARAHGAVTIAITNHPASPLARLAQIQLRTAAQDALSHGYPTGARAAQVVLINMLCVCISQLGREVAEQSAARLEEARKRRQTRGD